MKTNQSSQRRRRSGFSLVEVALGMMLTLGVAVTSLAMTNQHVRLMNALNSFSFLRDEAPTINLLLSRILQRADAYRIFASKGAAFSGSGAVNTGGSAVWLRYRNPDGTFAESVVAFETGGTRPGLNIYNRGASGWPGAPDWTISSRPAGVTFANDTGILLIRVTGPDSEQITYVGNAE